MNRFALVAVIVIGMVLLLLIQCKTRPPVISSSKDNTPQNDKMIIFIEGNTEEDETEIEERYELPELQYKATISLGKAYLELKKYEDALEYFDYMIDPRFGHESAHKTKWMIEFDKRVLQIRMQAYRWTAETYFRMEKWSSVIETVDELVKKIPEAVGTKDGKRTLMLKEKAYAAQKEGKTAEIKKSGSKKPYVCFHAKEMDIKKMKKDADSLLENYRKKQRQEKTA
jgi:tetratricopeptide (TPR) repeat protein